MYNKLIEVRTKKGISCEKMAELMHMSLKQYYIKESGIEINNKTKKNKTKDFTLEEMDKILKILDVKLEDIFL